MILAVLIFPGTAAIHQEIVELRRRSRDIDRKLLTRRRAKGFSECEATEAAATKATIAAEVARLRDRQSALIKDARLKLAERLQRTPEPFGKDVMVKMVPWPLEQSSDIAGG